MRRAINALLFALAIPSSIALVTAEASYARDPYSGGVVSLGLGLGAPSALDLKLWTGNASGFDFGVGLANFDDVLGLYGEYELGLATFALGNTGGRGAFYVGAGGALAFREDRTTLAAVIPIGVDFRFAAPIDLFIEARPGIGILHEPAFGIGGQLGVRGRF